MITAIKVLLLGSLFCFVLVGFVCVCGGGNKYFNVFLFFGLFYLFKVISMAKSTRWQVCFFVLFSFCDLNVGLGFWPGFCDSFVYRNAKRFTVTLSMINSCVCLYYFLERPKFTILHRSQYMAFFIKPYRLLYFFHFFTLCEFFAFVLTESFSLNSELHQVSSSLEYSSQDSCWPYQRSNLGCVDSFVTNWSLTSRVS